jgi:hypothetical protein
MALFKAPKSADVVQDMVSTFVDKYKVDDSGREDLAVILFYTCLLGIEDTQSMFREESAAAEHGFVA